MEHENTAAPDASDHHDPVERTVFVTVGTTEFDALIRRVRSPAILSLLASRNYQRVVFQIGRGTFEPTTSTDADGGSGSGEDAGVRIEWFRFKPSISEVIFRTPFCLT